MWYWMTIGCTNYTLFSDELKSKVEICSTALCDLRLVAHLFPPAPGSTELLLCLFLTTHRHVNSTLAQVLLSITAYS